MSFDGSSVSSICASRLRNIQTIIAGYSGEQPFHHYLKAVFNRNRGFGSTDRKIYRSWCYAWFRLGKSLERLDFYERLCVAFYLVHGREDSFWKEAAQAILKENVHKLVPDNRDDRINAVKDLYPEFETSDLFPFDTLLSGHLTRIQMARSMLVQPFVFIRILKGKEAFVRSELDKKGILYREPEATTTCLEFEPAVNLDNLESWKKGYFEIQDMASQTVGMRIPVSQNQHWWDCCSGAGGKSLQLLDRQPDINITASDIRETVLDNFRKRMKSGLAETVRYRVVNLETEKDLYPAATFDGIIADVPCSGSGTWARTPEQLKTFGEGTLGDFVVRQRKIVRNVLTSLKPGGVLVYITCSVFRAENEEMSNWISRLPGMNEIESALIPGFTNNSDSMYYALFKYY